jgi:hypothetical protein
MDADELLNDIQPQSSRIALAASWMAPAPEVASSQPEAELAPELALEVPKENPEAEAEMAAAETTETDAANQLETEKTDLASSVQATAQAKAEPLTDSPGAEQKRRLQTLICQKPWPSETTPHWWWHRFTRLSGTPIAPQIRISKALCVLESLLIAQANWSAP